IVRAAIDRIAIAVLRPVIAVGGIGIGIAIGLIAISLVVRGLVVVAIAAVIAVISGIVGLRACRHGQRAQATESDDRSLDDILHSSLRSPLPTPRSAAKIETTMAL